MQKQIHWTKIASHKEFYKRIDITRKGKLKGNLIIIHKQLLEIVHERIKHSKQ